MGRQKAIHEQNPLNGSPTISGTRTKLRRERPGVYRVGPSPQYVQQVVANQTDHVSSGSNATDSIYKAGSESSRWADDRKDTQATSSPGLPLRQWSNDTESGRSASQTTMSLPSSPRLGPKKAFQMIWYDPMKTSSSSIHAVRSNAARYQWKRSKAVRPRGRKSKIPEPLGSSSERTSAGQEDRVVDPEMQPDRNATNSKTISRVNKSWMKVPEPGRDNLLQPGGYPTPLPSAAVAPLVRLGRFR